VFVSLREIETTTAGRTLPTMDPVPDLLDGLTAAQRQVLARLDALGARDGRLAGSARVADGARQYAAAVALAQPWVTRYPLLDGAGNLGSDDGDEPADPEYTELGLSALGAEVLAGPVPAFFLNAVPHHLGEVVSAFVALMADPALDLDGLLAHVPGPDLPTGGVLVDVEPIRELYATGRATLRVRPCVRVERNDDAGQLSVLIDEPPHGVGRDALLQSIADAVSTVGDPVS
jgi:DNA gyrase subunit A